MSRQHRNSGGRDVVESSPIFHSAPIFSRQPVVLEPHRDEGKVPMPSEQYIVTPTAKTPSPSTSSISASVVWNIPTVIPIPPFYKLERTHVRIAEDVTLVEVTNRIVNVLRIQAIAAVYDTKEPMVSGETKCGVKFILRLWSTTDGTNHIIAECHRQAGCGFTYGDVAKKILKAAKTGVIKTKKKSPAPPVSADIIPVEEPMALVNDSMNLARERFHQNRVDIQLLAIDSLTHLSCSQISRVHTARSIVGVSGEDILEIVVSLILYSRLDRSVENSDASHVEKDIYDVMHRHALTFLANCLAALEEHGELEVALTKVPKLTENDLLDSLVSIVASSAAKPHEATDAFNCLDMLCLRSEVSKLRVDESAGTTYLRFPPKCY